jgi:hypothetical protein
VCTPTPSNGSCFRISHQQRYTPPHSCPPVIVIVFIPPSRPLCYSPLPISTCMQFTLSQHGDLVPELVRGQAEWAKAAAVASPRAGDPKLAVIRRCGASALPCSFFLLRVHECLAHVSLLCVVPMDRQVSAAAEVLREELGDAESEVRCTPC